MEPLFAHRTEDGRVLCGFCPRRCRLTESETGWCGALERSGDRLVAPARDGAPFRIDIAPAEASGLRRFCPGTAFAAILTRGSGLEVRTERREEHPSHAPWLTPEEAIVLARTWGCRGVYLKADDPVFGMLDGAELFERARAAGLRTALRTSGYLLAEGRDILFAFTDAVELRLFSVSETFYRRRFAAHVEPVLETIAWAASRPGLWRELAVPVVPGENDDPAELAALAGWVAGHLAADTPIHVVPGAPLCDASGLERAARALRAAGLSDVEAVVPAIPDPITRTVQ